MHTAVIDAYASELNVVDADGGLLIPSCGTDDFHFYTVAPAPAIGLLGEPDKWISVSSQRFSDLRTSKDGLLANVRVHGVPGEVVSVRWSLAGRVVTSKCVIADSGVSVASLDSKTGDATCEPEPLVA